MKQLPVLRVPQSLRARYILIALILFVLLIMIALYGRYSVQKGIHQHHASMAVVAGLEDAVHNFSLQYQGLKFATLEFLIQPDEKHLAIYQQSLARFQESCDVLEQVQAGGSGIDFSSHYRQLQNEIRQLRQGLDKLVEVRQDAEKTFPFSTMMLSIAGDNTRILATLDRVMQFTLQEEEQVPEAMRQLFIDTRYTWVRLMAEFRLLVAVRFGIFTGDWQTAYSNRVYNISVFIRQLDAYLKQMRQIRNQGELPLELEEDIRLVYELVNDATYYFQYAVGMLGTADWRQDIVLLREVVRPAFARLDSAIHALHMKEEEIQARSMEQLTQIARQLSDTQWVLLMLGSVLVLAGYIMFSRAILQPISNVAQALKDEATGKGGELDFYSSAREIQDLTDAFHEMRKQVNSRQKRLSNILDNAAEAIITVDASGVVGTFNAAAEALSGYAAEDMLGTPASRLLPADIRDQGLQNWPAFIAQEAAATAYETRILRRDGKTLPVSVKTSRTEIDGQVYYTALVVDISDRLAREKEKQQHLDAMAHTGRLSIMGEMAAGIAHELNQPLAAMSLYLQASLRRCDPDQEACADIIKAVKSSIEQVNRASDIIRRMRGFAHRESFHLEPVDLHELIHKSVELVRISEKNISPQAQLQLEVQPLVVNVDALQVEQVLVNLIRNACDAQQNTPESRRELIIRSERLDAGTARVTVLDAGEGVAEENADRIFDTYFTTKADGLGMGLSICRSIIEEHDGVLSYRRRDAGGSMFSFTLPLWREKSGEDDGASLS